MSDVNGLTQAVIDDGAEILLELWERLDADLSEKDRVAVSTAICKALDAGVKRGFAEVGAQLIEQEVPVELRNMRTPIEDEWAELYGGGG